MTKKTFRLIGLLAGITSITAFGAVTPLPKWDIVLDPNVGQTEFLAIGNPSALKIKGKGPSATGRLNITPLKSKKFSLQGILQFELDQFKTGMRLRDRHMKERYLEVKKHPKAILKIQSLELPAQFANLSFEAELPFKGTLSLHGVEKAIQGKVKLTRKAKEVQIQSQFKLALEDYEIGIPSFAGITVSKTVEISTNYETRLVPAQK